MNRFFLLFFWLICSTVVSVGQVADKRIVNDLMNAHKVSESMIVFKQESDGFRWYWVMGTRQHLAYGVDGKVLIPASVNASMIVYHPQSGGWFSLQKEDLEAAYDKNGLKIIGFEKGFTYILKHSDEQTGSYFLVKKGDAAGICNASGQVVIPVNPAYKTIDKRGNEDIGYYYKFSDGAKTGILSASGKVLVEPIAAVSMFYMESTGEFTYKNAEGEYVNLGIKLVKENEVVVEEGEYSVTDRVPVNYTASVDVETETDIDEQLDRERRAERMKAYEQKKKRKKSNFWNNLATAAEILSNTANTINGTTGTATHYNTNSVPASSGRTRAQIMYDLNKAKKLLDDMYKNQANSSGVSAMGYNKLIVNQKQVIAQLERELAHATR